MASTTMWTGPAILMVFCVAYALVFAEERLNLRKSKPVLIAAGITWILVAIDFRATGHAAEVGIELQHVLLQYAELFLFLLSAMSFVNAMVERNVFGALRARLMSLRLSVRGVFWVTGTIAFFLSPLADNLTTALVMGTLVISTIGQNKKATVGALVNVVVAANAGGAFSPFGDITTLMIWQQSPVEFWDFFSLFLPSLISWLIPAAIISFALKGPAPEVAAPESEIRKGGFVMAGLFLFTIALTILLDHLLHLPPFLGMMMGLGMLNVYSYFLHRGEARAFREQPMDPALWANGNGGAELRRPFDIFAILEKVEWDTLLFFYGIMLCIGGIAAVGYLATLSRVMYTGLGNTTANIMIGLLSAVIDNIPLTFAVLTMKPPMGLEQWLLVTLTAGIGGSLLSIGSAAGVALMGIGRGTYTFMSHVKWAWAILLGYAAAIAVHILLNHGSFAH